MFRYIKKMIETRREQDLQLAREFEAEYKQRLLNQQIESRKKQFDNFINSKLRPAFIVRMECFDFVEIVDGKELTYPRTDYFLSQKPISDVMPPYSQYKLTKITGKGIGREYEISESDQCGNICLIDSEGNKYTGFMIHVGKNIAENANTIKELNIYNEQVFNNPFKQMAKQTSSILK